MSAVLRFGSMKAPISWKLPGSVSLAIRSRALSLPAACCRAIAAARASSVSAWRARRTASIGASGAPACSVLMGSTSSQAFPPPDGWRSWVSGVMPRDLNSCFWTFSVGVFGSLSMNST